MDLSNLTPPERALQHGFASGDWVELRTGDPGVDGPAQGGGWGSARTVRAEVVAALLLGAEQLRPGAVAAVRLAGARITGRLALADGEVAVPFDVRDCLFEEEPDFTGARTRTVELSHCHLPGFGGTWMAVNGHLMLRDCLVSGELRLYGSHIAGELILSGTRVTVSSGSAVLASGMTVEHAFRAQRGFVCEGELEIRGASVGGGMFLEGARLSNRDGYAFAADGLVVGQTMQCSDGFVAEGTLRLRGAQINGTLSFDQAVLRAPVTALQLGRTDIAELILTPTEPIAGRVSLRSARIALIADDPAAWPADLRLSGLTYDQIRADNRTRLVAERLDWISRDPAGYLPQPYEQLAAWFRQIGHDDDARRVLLAKQRHRRTTLGPAGRIWGRVLDWTVGYGYRPWIAGLWLLGLLALGTAVFSLSHPVPITGGPNPHFNPFLYSIDLLTPIGPFGLRNAWAPQGWQQWLAYGLVTAGWILATTLIAGITRILRRS